MKKISYTIILAIAICSVVSGVAIGMFCLAQSTKNTEEQAMDNLLYMSLNQADSQDIMLEQVQGAVFGIVNSVVGTIDTSQMRDTNYLRNYTDFIGPVVQQAAMGNEQIMNAYIVFNPNLTGDLYQSIHTLIDGQFQLNNFLVKDQFDPDSSDMAWYYGPANAKAGVWSDPYVDANLQINMVTYSAPIYIEDTLIGVVGMDIDFTSFQKGILDIKVYDTGYAFLVNPNWDFLAHPKYTQEDNLKTVEDGKWKSLSSLMSSSNQGITSIDVSGQNKLIGYSKLSNGNTLAIVAPQDEALSKVKSLRVFIIIAVVIGAILSSLVAFVLGMRISKPIKMAAEHADIMAKGDFTLDIPDTFLKRKDEIGDLAESFNRLTAELNEVLSNITAASDQVAAGSKQVSQSSVLLSQGATEQASSIEELTASIEEVSSETISNAENANKAKTIVDTVKSSAELGNNQMKDMLTAMDEINVASNNISKIIKVIDDIAFQTNILALNAAVEAARAGQHGKGFAVVADEVRNLAARSANAAKETTELIEGSINKVNGGTKLANETAAALYKIVKEIAGVSEIINGIADASNVQAAEIQGIDQGIVQISQVVQTNSATSEESAAASEELSSQAELLKEQVSRFKLKKS